MSCQPGVEAESDRVCEAWIHTIGSVSRVLRPRPAGAATTDATAHTLCYSKHLPSLEFEFEACVGFEKKCQSQTLEPRSVA
jgi:hypothetical protein